MGKFSFFGINCYDSWLSRSSTGIIFYGPLEQIQELNNWNRVRLHIWKPVLFWFGTWFFFPYILGMSSSQLTKSIVFQRGRSTTNQLRWKASRVSWRANPIQCLNHSDPRHQWSAFFSLWTNPRLFWTRPHGFIGYIMLYHVISIISKKCTSINIACYIKYSKMIVSI